MPPVRFATLLILVIAAAAVTVGVAWGMRGSFGLPGGLVAVAAALAAARFAIGRSR